jgi:hypothetical protein
VYISSSSSFSPEASDLSSLLLLVSPPALLDSSVLGLSPFGGCSIWLKRRFVRVKEALYSYRDGDVIISIKPF